MNLSSSTAHRSLITRHFFIFLFLSTLSAHATRDLLVANPATNSILRFDGLTGASKGSFVAPQAGGLGDPRQMQVGPDGALYVADYSDGRIKCYSNLDGTMVRENGLLPPLGCPQALEFHNNLIYVRGRNSTSCTSIRRVNRNRLDDLSFVDEFIAVTSPEMGLSRDFLFLPMVT